MGWTSTGLAVATWRLVALLAAPTGADDVVVLEWSAPATCPTSAEVLARVEVGPAPHPVLAQAEVAQSDGGWFLRLRIEGYGGEDVRELEGESCEALADAVALLIQLGTGPEPETGARVTELQPAAEPRAYNGPSHVEAPPPAPTPVAVPPRPVHEDLKRPGPVSSSDGATELALHVRAVGLAQFGGLLPGTAAGGAGVATGITIPWVRAEVRGTYVAPRELKDSENPGVGIRVDGWTVGGSGCGVWDGHRLFVPGCLGAQLGRTRASSFGLQQDGVGRGLWAQAVADVGLGIRLSDRVAVVGGAEVAVSLRRPRFHVRGFPTLFQTGAAAGRVFLGVELHLGRRGGRGSRV
ncbi:MAG: hypothetical protein ACRBN8_44545 [Nannocystales bacterium]